MAHATCFAVGAGAALRYQYDVLNRLTNVIDNRLTGNKNTGYMFDGVGNLQSVSYPNGITNLWQHDALNRLTNLTWKLSGAQRGDFAYRLGPAGNRTNLVDNVSGTGRTFSWAYDNLYRLTNETVSSNSPTGSLGYVYDDVGNRTSRTGTLGSLTASNNTFDVNDWLDNDSITNNANPDFDANGNTRTNGSVYYGYDWANRLTACTNGSTVVSMAYDADGNRVTKTVGSTNTLYLVAAVNPSGYPQVVEELTVSGGATNLSKVYAYGRSLISQRQPGVSTNFFVCDGHGSTRLLAGLTGNVVNTFTYEAHGTLIASNDAPQTAYLYCGEQWDEEAAAYYFRARYYSPTTGRFLTMDVVEGDSSDPLSLHKYLYAADNPVNLKDPTGHELEMPSTLGAITIATALAALDIAAISQVTVNYQKYFGLSAQDRAIAIARNNDTMAALQRIIDSNGERTFQEEHLGVGGRLGAILPGNGPYQRAANLFERFPWNVEGWPSAIEEWFARIATDAFNPVPIPDSIAGVPEKRVILARALLNRSRAFDRWLRRNI